MTTTARPGPDADRMPVPTSGSTPTPGSAPTPAHRTPEELAAFVPQLLHAPRDVGTLKLVVRRPAPGEREVLDEGELDLAVGLVGDGWSGRIDDDP